MTDFYIASCEEKGGIYFCREEDGKIFVEQFTPCASPMYLEIAEGRLYTVLKNPGGGPFSGLTSFEIGRDGRLGKQDGIVSTKGIVGCHLTVRKSGVFVANYDSGSVFRTPDLLAVHTGHGTNPERQEAAHTHCVVSSPDGRYVCVADLGMDTVFVYDDELREISRVKLPDGKGPRHLVFGRDGKTVYCACELDSTVAVLEYSQGKLRYRTAVSMLPEGVKCDNTAAAIRISGNYLYASNRGHNSIAVFDIAGGMPEWVAAVDCGGDGPRDFNVCGSLLVCTNEKSGNVTLFRLEDGMPVRMEAELSMPQPLCVVFGG